MGTNCNNLLHDYGIQNEGSDLRAHVCPLVRRVYVYPTAEGRRVAMSGQWPRRSAYQPGVEGATAEGYLVPPLVIPRSAGVEVRAEAWDAAGFSQSDDTSTKGQKAVRFVTGMIRAGVFPLPYSVGALDADPALAMQIRGDDIIVDLGTCRVHIQVKCDFKGGDKALGGTGNLFLQVSERNPLKKV